MNVVCWRCHQSFLVDAGDFRPFFFHRCGDGFLTGVVNPGFDSWRRGAPCGVDSRSKEVRYDYRRRVYDR